MANIFSVRDLLSTTTKKSFSIPEVMFIMENSHNNGALEEASQKFGVNAITANDFNTYKLLCC